MRVNGITVDVDDIPKLNKNKKHSIEAVIDRLVMPKKRDDNFKLRLSESVENALNLGEGSLILFLIDEEDKNSAASSSTVPPISPIIRMPFVSSSSKNSLRQSINNLPGDPI